jgi:hypothetical protein
MQSHVLQKWITIRGDQTVTSVIQDSEEWLDLSEYSDLTAWVDVRSATTPSGSLTLTVESAPYRDELLFQSVGPAVTVGVTTSPKTVKSLKSKATASLAKWVRWKISVQGMSGTWDTTFRVRLAASRTAHFSPTQLSGCVLWLRSDLGITLSSSQVSGWADQSGYANDASQTGGSLPNYSAASGVNGLPKLIGRAAGASPASWMIGTFAATSAPTNHTAIAVVTYPTPITNAAAFAGCTTGYAVNSSFSQFTGGAGIYGRIDGGAGGADAIINDSSSLGSPGIYTTNCDSSNVDIWVNGVKRATSAAFANAQAVQYVLLALDNSGTYAIAGDAYEYIFFNRVLSAYELAQIHRYLGGRYSIAVP